MVLLQNIYGTKPGKSTSSEIEIGVGAMSLLELFNGRLAPRATALRGIYTALVLVSGTAFMG